MSEEPAARVGELDKALSRAALRAIQKSNALGSKPYAKGHLSKDTRWLLEGQEFQAGLKEHGFQIVPIAVEAEDRTCGHCRFWNELKKSSDPLDDDYPLRIGRCFNVEASRNVGLPDESFGCNQWEPRP